MKIFIALLMIAAALPAAAQDLPGLSDFFRQLETSSALPTPGHSVDGEVALVKGGPASVQITCSLADLPGDRARHVCSYRCNIWGIRTRPAEHLRPGVGAQARPDCYSALVIPRP